MSEANEIRILMSDIEKNVSILCRIYESHEAVCLRELSLLGKTQPAAMLVAGYIENYYTCLETVFLRISQFFENSLSPNKWHTDLLGKMMLTIPGVREAVISDETFAALLELLRFRHFKRYYFQLEYDWDKIEFLQKKLRAAHPLVLSDLKKFLQFLSCL